VVHITPLELSTVRLAFQVFVHMCALQRGEVIRIYTDNQVTKHVIKNMVSRSSTLMAELRCLHHLLQKQNLTLEMRYLPSVLNLFAD
jgi:TusA-related sulfurtransferase